MKLYRTHGWQTRLGNYLAGKRDEPFDWMHNNCVTFVTGAVSAMCDQDVTAPVRRVLGTCETPRAVRHALAEYGGLAAVLDAALLPVGAQRVNAAVEGDVVVCRDVHDTVGSGVCLGPCLAVMTTDGAQRVHDTTVVAAWRFPKWHH